MHACVIVYGNQFPILLLNGFGPILTIIHSPTLLAEAGVRVSRGGPGQWRCVNLVRGGTQQP
jgi:hypothetical protein